jgi:hypothetical protein
VKSVDWQWFLGFFGLSEKLNLALGFLPCYIQFLAHFIHGYVLVWQLIFVDFSLLTRFRVHRIFLKKL